ncbi:MAG: DUF420 domain-containing protein [Planctomycetota bacterium]|nr:MAG: DUF420 domain-containing protein [Planctomycetota bacterium]
MDFPGIDGFLGTRASLALDLVLVAMVAILPVLAWSIWLVKRRRRYELHKKVQLALALALAAAITLFEIDVRLVSGWRERAMPSPYYAATTAGPLWTLLCCDLLGMQAVPGWVFRVLAVHLVFAVSTTALWIVVTVRALRRFPIPPQPGPHSLSHRLWGQLAAWDMLATAITGGVFYWVPLRQLNEISHSKGVGRL